MDRKVGSYIFESGQITTLNSIFIITMVPLFDYVVYPIIRRFVRINFDLKCTSMTLNH
jgi:dipeptide/tripeptide permease